MTNKGSNEENDQISVQGDHKLSDQDNSQWSDQDIKPSPSKFKLVNKVTEVVEVISSEDNEDLTNEPEEDINIYVISCDCMSPNLY